MALTTLVAFFSILCMDHFHVTQLNTPTIGVCAERFGPLLHFSGTEAFVDWQASDSTPKTENRLPTSTRAQCLGKPSTEDLASCSRGVNP